MTGATPVITADDIRWRPAMETVLGVLAVERRARTVVMVRRRTDLGDRPVRNALADLVHKGLVTHQEGRPAWYRISDYGQRLVARNPGRFGL